MLTTLVKRAFHLFQRDLKPRVTATDFEKAAMNAFVEIFANVTVNGCHFHLCQSVLRKVNELGLKTTYESDAEFALHIRMLMGLAFISVSEVSAAFDVVHVYASMPAACKPVADYFNATYVNGPLVGRTTRRRPPQFATQIWNVSGRFSDSLPTTNNHVEPGITAYRRLS